jgi:hypothetical protein
MEEAGGGINIFQITAEDSIFQYADKQMIPDNQLSDTLKELAEKYAPKFASADDYYGYIDAWNGFVYNLQNPYGQAWVAYVPDAPIIGSLSDLPPDSPHIKMFITAYVNDVFYSPLGIFRSTIGTFEDQEKGTTRPNLSLFFHSALAYLVNK